MPRPRHVPGRGQNGQNGPKRLDSTPSPVGDPGRSGDLAARLNALAGGSIADLVPSDQLIIDFERVFTNATHLRFEHRTMLGLVINAMRPEHGKVTEFHGRIAERIGRGVRWVRDTASVAECIGTAIEQGMTLPLEIRELYWRKVPIAVENIRLGRPLDFTPKRERLEPTPEERTQAVAKALQALTKALEDIQSDTQRATLATDAIQALQPYTEAESTPEPEPEPEPGEPESSDPEVESKPDPEPHRRDPSRPSRPGRRRPGRNPRRRRR